MTADAVAAISPIVDTFQTLGVAYCVAGSIASSAYGIARSTLDVDLVADLKREHVEPLVAALVDGYYIEHQAVVDAVRRRSMFNVIHLATMLKVDLYLLTARAFDRESFGRRAPRSIETRRTHACSRWTLPRTRCSTSPWGDIVGVLSVQNAALDLAYLRRWASELDVSDLLDRALAAAIVLA